MSIKHIPYINFALLATLLVSEGLEARGRRCCPRPQVIQCAAPQHSKQAARVAVQSRFIQQAKQRQQQLKQKLQAKAALLNARLSKRSPQKTVPAAVVAKNKQAAATQKRQPQAKKVQATDKKAAIAAGAKVLTQAVVNSQSVAQEGNNKFLNSIRFAKRNLKPVPEQAKNAFAKSLAARRDYYDAQADLESFIKKLRISNGVVFKNETAENVTLEVQLSPSDVTETLASAQYIEIAPGKYYVLDQDKLTRLVSVKLVQSQLFLNPKWTVDSQLQINIETTQDRRFLHQYHGFNFASRPFTDEELNNPRQTQEEREFKQQFNSHLQYVDKIIAPAEGLTLKGIEEHRRALFLKNNMAKILQRDPEAMDRYENKIPLITHKIWVTSDENPVSIPNYYLKWYENSIKHNPTSAGWNHFLWIESKEKLPELAQKLANHPNIKIMELKDMPLPLVTGDLYKQAIADKQFGKATDILRLEILRQFGGFYLDTDYEVFQSLKPFSKVYDMVVAVEPMSALLCNAFIGARPDHPVIEKGLEMIVRNLNAQMAPDYIKNNNDRGFKTIVETGPGMITAAFALTAGKHGNVDIAMPPMLIYPTPVSQYPRKQVVKPGEAVPAEALGVHYWETAWMRAEFGSHG